ncbi:hypothetical protein BJ138DRAFT_788836 [Hygrophoropsis aurantiaca]|uniref:Uncharacterized protein n=1 Tax=Hygrophoropsis aurantiaca TaxID=72124 RepID=A0ACB8AG42_9AGAM|nr:hypothetical protein BJ138DRAFT_788836 [Hygrophoropsis aurantiaca]
MLAFSPQAAIALVLLIMTTFANAVCRTTSVAGGEWTASFYAGTDCLGPDETTTPAKIGLGLKSCVCKELSTKIRGHLESLVLSAQAEETNELFTIDLYGPGKKPCDSSDNNQLGSYRAGQLVKSTAVLSHHRSQVYTRYYRVCRKLSDHGVS